jgi:hypothetical protein
MSDDIVERLREYAEEWQIDRSVVDRAANDIIRLRALVEASAVLAQPGALTVNCVRGTVACQEAERLRARVEVLERHLRDAVSVADMAMSDANGCDCRAEKKWDREAELEVFRAALEAKP